MDLTELLREALRAIRTHALRSFLTLLGMNVVYSRRISPRVSAAQRLRVTPRRTVRRAWRVASRSS